MRAETEKTKTAFELVANAFILFVCCSKDQIHSLLGEMGSSGKVIMIVAL